MQLLPLPISKPFHHTKQQANSSLIFQTGRQRLNCQLHNESLEKTAQVLKIVPYFCDICYNYGGFGCVRLNTLEAVTFIRVAKAAEDNQPEWICILAAALATVY